MRDRHNKYWRQEKTIHWYCDQIEQSLALENERHNGLLRRYIPKGDSIDRYHAEEILAFSDEINGLPRKLLRYRTQEELFDTFLDKVFAV